MTWMYISWHPIAARVNLGDTPRRGSVTESYSFGENLNRALRGLILLSATLPFPFERVVCLTFSESVDHEKKHSLFCEVMGRHSNVVLTDVDGQIKLCAQQIGVKQSSVRQLQVGSPYKPPPSQIGVPPKKEISKQEFCDMIGHASTEESGKEKKISSILVRCFQGIGPCLAQDLLSKSHIDSESKYSDLTTDQMGTLYGEWSSWLDRLEAYNFDPKWCKDTGKYSLLGLSGIWFKSVHNLLDSYYRSIELDNEGAILTNELHSCIKKTLTRIENKQKKLLGQIKDSEKAEEVQKKGELIIANLHNYVPGSSVLSVVDWTTGESIKMNLDPLKSARESAEEFFKKSKKLKRTKASVQPLLDAVDQELTYIKEVEESIIELEASDDEEDLTALTEIKDELISGGYMKPPSDHHLSSKSKRLKKRPPTSDPKSEGFRLFWSPNEFRILIGRSNKQNDEISKTKGKTGDYWFHARGVPGAHVLLKLDGKGYQPEEEDLYCAARLAAYYSKAREGGKVSVSMTKAENVSKPKGAPPGLVQIVKERALQVRPSDSLASKKARTN
eukprot:g4612.t1